MIFERARRFGRHVRSLAQGEEAVRQASNTRVVSSKAAAVLTVLVLLSACRTAPPVKPSIRFTPVPAVPQSVHHVAVFYPAAQERDMAYGYARLEQAVLQLKRQRPWVRVLDRRYLATVTAEQRLQTSGRFSDDGAVHIGRLLGADSIVVFHIDGPGWRDRLLARMHGSMPPLVVSSKVVRVETGEVLYHDMVVGALSPGVQGWEAFATDFEVQPLIRASLEDTVSEAIVRLNEAFR